MTQLPLPQAIDRFKKNDERLNQMTNGPENETWVDSAGVAHPTLSKLIKTISDQSDDIIAETQDNLEKISHVITLKVKNTDPNNIVVTNLSDDSDPAGYRFVILIPTFTNTGAATLNGFPIVTGKGDPLTANMLLAEKSYLLGFDKTSYRMISGDAGFVGVGSTSFKENLFTGNGVNKTFNLTFIPANKENLFVWVGGSKQNTGSFSISNNQLTFVDAPANLTEIQVLGMVTSGVVAIDTITGLQAALDKKLNVKDGEIQNLWSDGVVNQIVSSAKGQSFLKTFSQLGTGSEYDRGFEPMHRTQGFRDTNIFNANAPDGYRGLLPGINVLGHLHQYVFGPRSFEKQAGDMIEVHDKSPNGGEHYGSVYQYFIHADRKSELSNDPDTAGFFDIKRVADAWNRWEIFCDNAHKSNGFLTESNMRNEWGTRPETLNPHSQLIPDSDHGFMVMQTWTTDFSQYHVTRGFQILPSNSWGSANGAPNIFVGVETGGFIAGFAKFGLVFSKSIHYADPHNPAGTVTNPMSILFANNDTDILGFFLHDTLAMELVRLTDDIIGFVRNSDGHHMLAMNPYTGETFLGNGNFKVNQQGETLITSALALNGFAVTTAAPAAGGAQPLPATPTQYVTVTINGVARKLAVY